MRDRDEFDEFYANTAARVVAHLYAMIGDLAEAEDAVQEAYARAWQRWRHVGTYGDPVSWVRVVAYRIAVSSWRRSRARWAAQLRSRQIEQAPELNPDTVALVAALQKISTEQREAIVLHHLLGLTVQEIATETGVTASAVKARLVRGRTALAPLLVVDDPNRAEADKHG
jgi:RNA polymerase sigma-70 factor (ECF subfamily)